MVLRRQLCLLQLEVLQRNPGNPLIVLDQQDVLVLEAVVDLIQHGHHAVHELLPEVLDRERVPEVVITRLAQQRHVLHLEHPQSRRTKLEVPVFQMGIKYLSELLEADGEHLDHQWVVLDLFSEA